MIRALLTSIFLSTLCAAEDEWPSQEHRDFNSLLNKAYTAATGNELKSADEDIYFLWKWDAESWLSDYVHVEETDKAPTKDQIEQCAELYKRFHKKLYRFPKEQLVATELLKNLQTNKLGKPQQIALHTFLWDYLPILLIDEHLGDLLKDAANFVKLPKNTPNELPNPNHPLLGKTGLYLTLKGERKPWTQLSKKLGEVTKDGKTIHLASPETIGPYYIILFHDGTIDTVNNSQLNRLTGKTTYSQKWFNSLTPTQGALFQMFLKLPGELSEAKLTSSHEHKLLAEEAVNWAYNDEIQKLHTNIENDIKQTKAWFQSFSTSEAKKAKLARKLAQVANTNIEWLALAEYRAFLTWEAELRSIWESKATLHAMGRRRLRRHEGDTFPSIKQLDLPEEWSFKHPMTGKLTPWAEVSLTRNKIAYNEHSLYLATPISLHGKRIALTHGLEVIEVPENDFQKLIKK